MDEIFLSPVMHWHIREADNDNNVVFVDFGGKQHVYDCPAQECRNNFIDLLIDFEEAYFFAMDEKQRWSVICAFADRLEDMCDAS